MRVMALKGGPRAAASPVALADVDANLPSLSFDNQDWVTVVPKDPGTLFCRWQISPEFRNSARAAGGQDFCLRLYESADGGAAPHASEITYNEQQIKSYVPVPHSGRHYRVELGYRTSREWLPLVSSIPVATPPLFSEPSPLAPLKHVAESPTYASVVAPAKPARRDSVRELTRELTAEWVTAANPAPRLAVHPISQPNFPEPHAPRAKSAIAAPGNEPVERESWKPIFRGPPSALPWESPVTPAAAIASSIPSASSSDHPEIQQSDLLAHGDSEQVSIYLFGVYGHAPSPDEVSQALLQPEIIARARHYVRRYILGPTSSMSVSSFPGASNFLWPESGGENPFDESTFSEQMFSDRAFSGTGWS